MLHFLRRNRVCAAAAVLAVASGGSPASAAGAEVAALGGTAHRKRPSSAATATDAAFAAFRREATTVMHNTGANRSKAPPNTKLVPATGAAQVDALLRLVVFLVRHEIFPDGSANQWAAQDAGDPSYRVERCNLLQNEFVLPYLCGFAGGNSLDVQEEAALDVMLGYFAAARVGNCAVMALAAAYLLARVLPPGVQVRRTFLNERDRWAALSGDEISGKQFGNQKCYHTDFAGDHVWLTVFPGGFAAEKQNQFRNAVVVDAWPVDQGAGVGGSCRDNSSGDDCSLGHQSRLACFPGSDLLRIDRDSSSRSRGRGDKKGEAHERRRRKQDSYPRVAGVHSFLRREKKTYSCQDYTGIPALRDLLRRRNRAAFRATGGSNRWEDVPRMSAKTIEEAVAFLRSRGTRKGLQQLLARDQECGGGAEKAEAGCLVEEPQPADVSPKSTLLRGLRNFEERVRKVEGRRRRTKAEQKQLTRTRLACGGGPRWNYLVRNEGAKVPKNGVQYTLCDGRLGGPVEVGFAETMGK